jgi:hypothetical protein
MRISERKALRYAKWLLGAIAAVAVYLLVQPAGTIPPALELALGAFLVFAAYADPGSVARTVTRGRTNTGDSGDPAVRKRLDELTGQG